MIVTKKYDSGVMLLTPDRLFHDNRGYFVETKRESEMIAIGIPQPFVQTSFSNSAPFVLRGLHYQLRPGLPDNPPQGKLMRCVRGAIYHVCVDMRHGSARLGDWWGHHLDDRNCEAVWVPPGFAAGFYARDNGATVHYEMSGYHDATLERAVIWNDPTIGVKWPMGTGAPFVMSAKDRAAVRFGEAELYK